MNPIQELRSEAEKQVKRIDDVMELAKRAYVAFGGQLCESCEGLIVEDDEIIDLDEAVIHDTKACREEHKAKVKDEIETREDALRN